MADGESSLTEAERRRVRRRQRILENQGSRIDKILGGSGSSKSSVGSEVKGSSDFSLLGDEDVLSGASSSTSFIHTKPAVPSKSSSSSVQSNSKVKETTDLPQLLKELSEDFSGLQSPTVTTSSSADAETERPEVKMGVQSDGTVIMPKIPHYVGRIMICLLALFLSLMNAKQFAVTFMSLEVAYYFLNGLPPYPPPNSALVALALVGMKDGHLRKVKKVLHIFNCISVDFSLFITFVMIPHVASKTYKDFLVD